VLTSAVAACSQPAGQPGQSRSAGSAVLPRPAQSAGPPKPARPVIPRQRQNRPRLARREGPVPAQRGIAAHRSPAGPAYPVDRPLYYIRDTSTAIALTIDDGPDPVYTPQVLRLLHKYQVTATFSMIGIHVAAYPHLARAVAEAGHAIANHTWTHAWLAGLPAPVVHDELAQASRAIRAAAGVQPRLFRAPYGAWSAEVIKLCGQMSMVPLDWSVDPRDWTRPGVRSIVRTIMTNTRPGSIILEHDGGGNRSQTVAALRIVLPRLLHEGYHFQKP
jgi:peptidoglycan/xylan/chitin deacetylase (PgdA/CDA1 family)